MLVDFEANVKKRDRILIKQGKVEAEAKAYAEKIEIAKRMFKRGTALEIIAEDTGLDKKRAQSEKRAGSKYPALSSCYFAFAYFSPYINGNRFQSRRPHRQQPR